MIDFDNEKWLQIKEYENIYEISNYGRVKSLKRYVPKYNGLRTVKERILKQGNNTQGYKTVMLCKNGVHKSVTVHRLVAIHFIENEDTNKIQVNHINENKTDNRVENLEWVTPKENTNWGSCIERRKNKMINHPKRSKFVYQFTKDGALVQTYLSTKEVFRQTGYSQSKISECCLGKRKTAYNHVWKYNN